MSCLQSQFVIIRSLLNSIQSLACHFTICRHLLDRIRGVNILFENRLLVAINRRNVGSNRPPLDRVSRVHPAAISFVLHRPDELLLRLRQSDIVYIISGC